MWEHFKRTILNDNRGFLQFLPAIIGAGTAAYAATRKKPNSALENFQLPDYFEDPDYREMQDIMTKLGPDILKGDIPDYYKGIGEPMGAEFENYLNLMTGDIEKAGLETGAAMGRGGGDIQSMINESQGRFLTEARLADLDRVLKGKQWLFGEGTGITERARAAGQQEGVNKNAFNLENTKSAIGLGKYWDQYDAMGREWEAQKGQAIGEGLFSTAGAFMGAKDTNSIEGGISGLFGNYDWSKFLKPKDETVKDPYEEINKKLRGSFQPYQSIIGSIR